MKAYKCMQSRGTESRRTNASVNDFPQNFFQASHKHKSKKFVTKCLFNVWINLCDLKITEV